MEYDLVFLKENILKKELKGSLAISLFLEWACFTQSCNFPALILLYQKTEQNLDNLTQQQPPCKDVQEILVCQAVDPTISSFLLYCSKPSSAAVFVMLYYNYSICVFPPHQRLRVSYSRPTALPFMSVASGQWHH